jgi:nucleoside-diphosphate-sugar epimerase
MHILVTGSSGTIGTRLCERLLEEGHTVTGIDWLKNKWQPSIDALTRIVDLRDENATHAAELPDGIDAVVHLAANARVYELVEHPERARDNFLTLFNMLELARRRGIKRFMFASSRESYGNIPAETYTEDLVRVENCESPYTASKVGGEALVEAYRRCYGIDQITFRFSNVYGMYDDSVRVVPLFIRLCRANGKLAVFGKDKCLDFTYIDDTVGGIILALENFESAKNQTYNLAYGEGTTLVHLAERVKELLGSTSEITVGQPRIGEVVRYVANIEKARKAFGYSPATPFEEGIRKAVEWYTEHLPA